jgi:DNA (cytosine-5)-methyltransferase 1
VSRQPFTFYEFFAGGGMARLGLGDGWRCAFANDFDPVKAATYRANFADASEHFHEGDVWALTASDLPGQADLAWASSPCQDFSLAGARAGLAGGRSSAFFGFWTLIQRLAKEGRAPGIIVIENVVGLLTSHAGADFRALCQALSDAEYRFGALEIDAARFVPQSRQRVFIVAVRHEPPVAVTQVEPAAPYHSRKIEQAFEGLPEDLREKWIWWHLPYPPTSNLTLDAIIIPDSEAKWLGVDKAQKLIGLVNGRHKKKLSLASKRNVRTIGTLFRRMRVEDGEKVQRGELRFDGIAGCLRTPGGGSSKQFVVVVDGEKTAVRQLTPREGARLMGIEEEYNLPAGVTAAFKVIGDGVAVPVVQFLRRQLLEKLLA